MTRPGTRRQTTSGRSDRSAKVAAIIATQSGIFSAPMAGIRSDGGSLTVSVQVGSFSYGLFGSGQFGARAEVSTLTYVLVSRLTYGAETWRRSWASTVHSLLTALYSKY